MATVDPQAQSPQAQKHVYLIGHSYVRRLGEFMDSKLSLRNLNLDETCEIHICARGGLTTVRLPRILNFCQKPDACFLQIGGNDIGQLSNSRIVSHIMAIASYLVIGVGVTKVIIGQLLRRRPDVVCPSYNDCVIDINLQLEEIIRTQEHNHVVFWKHRGFWRDMSHLGRDGVHLHNPTHTSPGDPPSPMFKYWRSIRNAVIVHVKNRRPV
jgi:hypothetical protein